MPKRVEFFGKLPPCLVGMEACATSHQWARELKKLGHDVRLMPPSYVKAYVKRGKNDAADAAAICEAVRRPSMRYVPIKSTEQQSALMLHRTRDLLIRQRTQLINAIRAHLAELGLVAQKGREGLQELMRTAADADDEALPSDARFACQAIVAQLQAVQMQIAGLDKRMHQAHRANPASKRLETIPGFGVIVSTAVVATMTDPKAFKTGREFAAWIGLVPRQNSTGGKDRLGSISKQGDRYYDACSSSVRSLSLGAHARGQTSIPGSLPCWAGDRPRWSLWRSPTRWRASPGRYWPRARLIERQCTQAAERLRRAHKGLGKGNIGSRRERKGTSRVMMA
jgi:transposase